MDKNHGYFIVFEGLEKTGKATQIKKCEEALKRQDYWNIVTTNEPSDSPIGNIARKALCHPKEYSPRECQTLCTADRIYHVKNVIKPAIERNGIVLCKRYLHSTIAYGAPYMDPKVLAEINSEMPIPDLVLFLDINLETIAERRMMDGYTPDLFERDKPIFQKVLEAYKNEYGMGFFITRIDGNGSIEKVHKNVMNHVLHLLGHNVHQTKMFKEDRPIAYPP